MGRWRGRFTKHESALAEYDVHHFDCLFDNPVGNSTCVFRFARSPVDTLHLICQHHSRDCKSAGKRQLEHVSFCLIRYRANYCKSGSSVVSGVAHY